MTTIYVPAASTVPAPVKITGSSSTEIQRLARRANLRSCARSLLRELSEQHDHAVDPHERALVTERMGQLRDELVAALRGDDAAIESLAIKSQDPIAQ